MPEILILEPATSTDVIAFAFDVYGPDAHVYAATRNGCMVVSPEGSTYEISRNGDTFTTGEVA